MLIATSPRLCSDQEKKSTEDGYPVEVDCMSSKCIYNNSGGKRGEMTNEEHSRLIPNSQSAYELMADGIITKQPREFCNNQQKINAESSVYNNPVTPKLMRFDIQHPTEQPRESQGEEFIYYIQPAEARFEELHDSLETDVQNDSGNFLQTATVKSEELTVITPNVRSEALQCSLKLPTIQLELDNPPQSPSAQSQDHTKDFPISTSISDELCNTIKTVQFNEPLKSPITSAVQSEGLWTLSQTASIPSEGLSASLHTTIFQSEGLSTSSHIVTVQSEGLLTPTHAATVQTEAPFTTLKTENVQSDEICSFTKTCDVSPVKPSQCLQDKNIPLDGHRDSLCTAKDQPEDVFRPPHTSTVEPKGFGYLSNVPSSQRLEFCSSKMAQSVHIEDHFNLQQPVPDDLSKTGQAVTSHSEVSYQSLQAVTAKAMCRQTMKATENQEAGTAEPVRRSPTQFAEPYYVKQASTAESEEIYLSCGNHGSDSVTAYKVAVEGDLMASIIKPKVKGHIVVIVQNEVIAFCSSSCFDNNELDYATKTTLVINVQLWTKVVSVSNTTDRGGK